jgi:hypothetical protein
LTLQLLQAALAHQHAGAARLLDAMAACPAPSRELLAHPQLFAQACATAAHLEPLACVLAGSGRCPPAAWAAWLQAVSQRQQTAALATFVDRANPIHDGYRPALEKLTELLRRNPGAPGGPMAEAGWRRLYDRACQAGEEASQEALALLTLEAPQRGLGRTVFTFTDAEAYDLCCRVLFNVEDQPSVTLALTRLRHLDDPDMTMEGFVFCLQTVAPTMLHQGWGEGWHAYLGAMLTEIQPHIGDLDRTVAGNLVELASLGFTTDGIALNQACEVAALTVHLVLGHHCPELAFTLLQHGTAKPEAQHPLMHHLLHAPGIGLMNRNWLSVVKTMAQKVSPRVQQLAPDPAHVPLHQISFWAQWTERLIEARLHPDLYEALGPQTTVTNLQDCLGLLRVRHVFVPLRSDEPLLTELSLRLQDPRLHELALTYLRDLNQLCRRLPGTIGGPASEPPPAPLWHAVLRGQALYRDDATLARQLLGEVAGVCFEGQPAVVHERTPLRGITFATELADVLLGDAQYDHQGRRALIESLACRDLHEPEALQRLHILHQRATTAGHDKDDAPVFMAVKALVADGRRVGAMTPLQRTQYELAAAYLAHALCISHDELPASLRAQAIIELLDNLGPVSSNLWSALTYILSDEESLLTATSEDGARCLAQFRQRNALGTQAPVAGQLDATIGQTIVLSHLNLALARLGAPHLSVVSLGVAVHHFMDMHVLFDHSQTLTMFQDFQRALTLLCRQERLNSGMLEALVVRLLDPSYERLSGRFIDYLFEALLGAAPINACHLGIYMAVSQQLQTSATHSSRRGARIKDMLRQSNKQMVQGATALSRTLSRCALEAQQQPERVEQLSHEALRVYVDLWPHGWPSPACEPI